MSGRSPDRWKGGGGDEGLCVSETREGRNENVGRPQTTFYFHQGPHSKVEDLNSFISEENYRSDTHRH